MTGRNLILGSVDKLVHAVTMRWSAAAAHRPCVVHSDVVLQVYKQSFSAVFFSHITTPPKPEYRNSETVWVYFFWFFLFCFVFCTLSEFHIPDFKVLSLDQVSHT